MGREVRHVPENWQHPKNDKGDYIPLLGDNYQSRLDDWNEASEKWQQGLRENWGKGEQWIPIPVEKEYQSMSYDEWDGPKPELSEYMPQWSDSEKTHIVMYETTSEGTPISPAFKTPEELARWLVDNNASSFADRRATYEQWLNTIKDGWAISGVRCNGKLMSGVEATTECKNG